MGFNNIINAHLLLGVRRRIMNFNIVIDEYLNLCIHSLVIICSFIILKNFNF